NSYDKLSIMTQRPLPQFVAYKNRQRIVVNNGPVNFGWLKSFSGSSCESQVHRGLGQHNIPPRNNG
ncbi:hypothetical protein Hamer_G029614, partial [Homarus americanus]